MRRWLLAWSGVIKQEQTVNSNCYRWLLLLLGCCCWVRSHIQRVAPSAPLLCLSSHPIFSCGPELEILIYLLARGVKRISLILPAAGAAERCVFLFHLSFFASRISSFSSRVFNPIYFLPFPRFTSLYQCHWCRRGVIIFTFLFSSPPYKLDLAHLLAQWIGVENN